jgi:ferritin-like metal-binding protein YciE
MAGETRVVDYLREARQDELALARTLRSHIAVAPRGAYRRGLEGYLRETRDHAKRVQRRLGELGAGDGPLRTGARAIRHASGGLAARGRGPLNVIRRASPEEPVLSGAQYGCATQGMVIATYTALELVARRAGDESTAELASGIREEEQQMLEWLRHEILKLTDPFIRDELDALDGYGELSEGDVKTALSRAERDRAHRV